MRISLLISFFLFFAVTTISQPKQLAWEAVSTQVTFTIDNAGLTVNGKFDAVEGQFVTDLASKLPILVTGVAKVKSIDTGIGLRDRHLQGADYFDAKKYPELRMQLLDADEKTARFAIIIRGKTKTISVPYVLKATGDKAAFKCSFELNRRDFGVGGASLIMSDKVVANIELDLRKKK